MEKPKVVIILPRGEAIRNFVYSGMIQELRKATEVHLFSVIPNETIRLLLEDSADNVIELSEVHESWLPRFVREILEMAHGRYLWSKAAQVRWRLRDIEAKTISQKVKRWVKKLLCYPFASKSGLAFLSTLECALSHIFRTSDFYFDRLREIKPNLVFNGSHVHSRLAIPVMHAARALNIPTATFIFSWDNLTSQGRIIPPCDYYLVWNESICRQLLQIYPSVTKGQVFVTGTPQFDFHFRPEYWWSREQLCEQIGADPARPIVLYTTGMANHMPGEPLIVERIAEMLIDLKEFGSPQLVVRVYPKDQTGRFGELKKRRKDILFPDAKWEPAFLTPLPDDSYLLVNLLRHADVGINVASTISLELCMFHKPVINVGYNPPGMDIFPIDYKRYYEFDHYRPIVESGAVEVALTEKMMIPLLRSALVSPGKWAEKCQNLLKKFFDNKLDGNSSQRVARILIELSENG